MLAFGKRTSAGRHAMTTTTALRHVKVAPKGMGLNDFVAHKEGFFEAEGLDVE